MSIAVFYCLAELSLTLLAIVAGIVNYCYNSTLDITFVIDDSSNIASSDWRLIQQFITQVADKFYVSPTLTRFAVIKYSDTVVKDFTFSQYTTNAALRQVLNNIQQRAQSTLRQLADAFRFAWNNLFNTEARTYANKVCLGPRNCSEDSDVYY